MGEVRPCEHKKGKKQKPYVPKPEEVEPDWNGKCIVCGMSPIMPITEMCGPCTFGEADTVDGNW